MLKKLTLILNKNKKEALYLGKEISKLGKTLNLQIKSKLEYPLPKNCLKGQNLCIVLGGDGTLLSTVKQSVETQVPVLGINQGKLGFLATFSPENIKEDFLDIINEKFIIENRAIIACKTEKEGELIALNDVVIKSQSSTELIRFELFIQKSDLTWEFITEYACDGLIFSTPTGSTAYNLSAGGPIVHPCSKTIVMTPICPHTLSNRSLVFPENNIFKVRLKKTSTASAQITIDGQAALSSINKKNDSILIAIYKKTFPLVLPLNYNYFSIMSKKLKWG